MELLSDGSLAVVMNSVRMSAPPNAQLVTQQVGRITALTSRPFGAYFTTEPPFQRAFHT